MIYVHVKADTTYTNICIYIFIYTLYLYIFKKHSTHHVGFSNELHLLLGWRQKPEVQELMIGIPRKSKEDLYLHPEEDIFFDKCGHIFSIWFNVVIDE